MKPRALTCCFLVLILILSLLCITVKATKYNETDTKIEAKDILQHIQTDDDINLMNCTIVGELNTSNLKLKTINNSYFSKLLDNYTRDKLYNGKLNDRSLIIESNITIENSTFKNKLNFSNVKFKNTLSFKKVNFDDNVDFIGANFVNSAYFNGTEFKTFANFSYADFNNSAYFNDVKFTGRTDFFRANFNSSAYFNDTTKFRSNTEFSFANFTGLVDFSNVYFVHDVNFNEAKFANFTNFTGTRFNDSAKFIGPSIPTSFIVDDANYHVFSRYYNNLNQFVFSDELYYKYRIYNMKQKSRNDIGFWSDAFLCFIYGFGVKPLQTIIFSIFIIFIFSIIYICPINWKNLSSNIHLDKVNNKVITLSLNNPGIKKNDQNQKANIFDIICYSICCFISQPHENLCPTNNYYKIVSILEGILGWITLGVFISTLASFIMRKP